MLTIFRTQPKDRDNRPNEPEPQQVKPPVEKTFPSSQIPVQPPSLTPPRQSPVSQSYPASVSQPIPAGSTTIGKDLVFEGNIQGRGSIRVEGDFKGTLEVQNEVIIGEGGTVNGDIKANVVTVEGKLNGNVEARHKIAINVTGVMLGDIIAPRVVVASGAIYKGRIDMEAALKQQQKSANEKKDDSQARPQAESKKTSEPAVVMKSAEPAPASESPKPIPGPPPPQK